MAKFMEYEKDVKEMYTTELAHNCMFVKDGEAWYRDFEREISLRNLMREICAKHATPADTDNFSDEELDDVLFDNLQYGTDELEGVFALLNMIAYGAADMRELLKRYETWGLPTTAHPETLKECIEVYGKEPQVDMAIEEMSELTKVLLKHRRAEKNPAAWNYERTRQNILEETADVIIMLTQIIMIYGGRDRVQKIIDDKVKRQKKRLEAAKEAGQGAAMEVLQPAT